MVTNRQVINRVAGFLRYLARKKADYTDDDIHQMHRVISYIKRHTAQRPDGDISDIRWRYSLMNWGNDPMKD